MAERQVEWEDDDPADAPWDGARGAPQPGGERDVALMGRLRLGEEAAFAEYLARFTPLLREMARRFGVPDDDSALVGHVLDEVAVRIRAHLVPRDAVLGRYLVGALRHHLAEGRRERGRRAQLEREAAGPPDGEAEPVVRSLCSAYALRAARAIDDLSDPETSEPARALLAFLEARMTEEEMMVLGWLAEHVSQRDIAAWTGTTHGAARVRAHRLRARLAEATRAWAEGLDPATRRVIERRYLGAAPRRAREAPPAPHEEER